MENATDALMMAFAVFIFVIAITLIFSLVSQAKSTADYVLFYNDKTNFYEHSDSKEKNREVSVTEVISSLYRYYKESLCVTVWLLNGSEYKDYKFDLSNTYSTVAQVEKKLAKFIKEELLSKNSEVKFIEEFVEVPVSGTYKTGEDGTQITLSPGGKKLYITYTEMSEK